MKKLSLLMLAFCLPLALSAAPNWKAVMRYDKQKTKTALTDRLVKYAAYNTQDAKGQAAFAKVLAKELKQIGASGVAVSKAGIVTAEIPATSSKPAPGILLAAAMNTPAGAPGTNVRPQVHTKYMGGDIVLSETEKIREYDYPQLLAAHGHDIITASGGTQLGAAGKAGIAVIMTLADYLLGNTAIDHGPVKIAFVPDAFRGGEKIDASALKADYTYVAQGGNMGEYAAENFGGRAFTVVFEGNIPADPGRVNAASFADNLLMMSDFHTLLPRHRRPENTAGQRGFVWISSITHEGARSSAHGIIRAFTETEMNELSALVTQAFNTVKAMNPARKDARLEFTDEFQNPAAQLPAQLSAQLEQAMREEEITPKAVSVRANTLAGQLTAQGLPALSVFTGVFGEGNATEYADVDVMEGSLRTLASLLSARPE